MANSILLKWLIEHSLKVVELFVVVPVALLAATFAFAGLGLWIVADEKGYWDTVSNPPKLLIDTVKWPFRALEHIPTGQGGFHWTPTV